MMKELVGQADWKPTKNGSFNYTYRHYRSSLLRLVDSHNENLSGHSMDSKYLHIYKGCFHRDA